MFRYRSNLLPNSHYLIIDNHNSYNGIQVKSIDISRIAFEKIEIFGGRFGKLITSVDTKMENFCICLSTFISLNIRIQDFDLIDNFVIDSNKIENLFIFYLDKNLSELTNLDLKKLDSLREIIASLKVSI